MTRALKSPISFNPVDFRSERTLSAGTASANRTAKGSICRISVFFAEIKAFSPRAPNANAFGRKSRSS